MAEILTPRELIEVSFEDKDLKTLQGFAYPSESGNEEQVRLDIRRTHALTIGKWYHEMRSESSFAIKTSAGIEPDPEEVFFNKIKSLDKKIQDFILLNFHQGGMFYAARQFLTFHLNILGFKPDSKHHIICDFDNSEELVITEKFSIAALDFIPKDWLLSKVISKDGKLFPINFEQTEKDKILYFQEHIMKLLDDKVFSNCQQASLYLEKKDEQIRLASSTNKNENLIEFSVKHTLKLDPTSPTPIKIKRLSKEDVEFKVQAELYGLSSTSSEPQFFKLLSPNLSCVSPGFFKKPKLKSKLREFIINNYQDFILILFKILLNFSSPIVLPEKAPSFMQVSSTDPQNNFAQKMRA